MAELEFIHVNKVYGSDTTAVRDLSLHVGEGEFVVLVGPSGCGKTTALRMVAGLEEITSGEIRIGDRVVNDLAPRERDIAMVFQNYALYPHKSVYENLAFGLRMRKVSKAEQRRRVEEIARKLGLADMLQRRPAQLSGGQRQRVAMGRAIVREPAAFLFDEPLSNLDAKLRVQMRAEITRLQQTLGTTSVYVTHDQVEAMTMGHRITVLREGKIQQIGTPGEVYEHPANVFVAQFIGTPPMNLIPATALPLRLPLAEGRPMIAGIRPEHLTLGDGFPATIDLVEPIGHESIVYATAGSEKLVAIFDPHDAPRTGETVSLAIDADRMHLFDAQSEIALSPRA